MIKNNVYYELFASIIVPNHEQVGYWIDLGADSKGRIIKVYNQDLERWVVLFDVSKDDYVPPFIGTNGNWWVDNRDTGVKATAESPYIGDNDHWFTYDPVNKVYVDTGLEARGLSAYDIAVKLGFKGSEQDWLDSLKEASESAAIVALEAANKANEATDKANEAIVTMGGIVEDAIEATNKAEKLNNNPPKIVDGSWWFFDITQDKYVDSGIQAIGDAFTYKKEYTSVAEMEADWGTADVKLGEYVLINTNNVEDPDDAKVYLKTANGWKFIVDLSGMQGIQGWSAYELAVKHGFVGTEEEWIQSLKQPSLDAAAEALAAKAKVEVTEKAVKEAEALRVTAEQGRINAENTRVSNEDARTANENNRKAEEAKRVTAENNRIAAEESRKSEENVRKTNEANRISAESARVSAETLRASAEVERNTNEQKRIDAEKTRTTAEQSRVNEENIRKSNETDRLAAETSRVNAESQRESNEAVRQANETVRETQEAAREKNTNDALNAVNEAKTAAQQATTNATTAASNANTQASRAKEYADNPPKVGEDGYWYTWNGDTDTYVKTGWSSSGILLKGSLNSPEDLNDIVDPQLSDSYIVGTDLYFWNGTEWVNMGRFQGPQGEPGKDAELSKAAIEAVLVGEVTTHTHDTRYYTKDQTDANIKVVADDLANNYYNKSQVDSKFTSVYIFKGSVDTVEDLPTEGNVIGDVWNVRKNDTNYAWTSEGWDTLGGTAELSSLTANGLMSKEDFAKLQNIEAGAQVNKIESITKRVALNVVNKNVTIPEDIKISNIEPTEEEILWLDPSENYDFTFDGYSQAQADELFVKKEQGKGLSTNDYTATDKIKVTNLTDYIVGGTGAVVDANAATITLTKKNPTTGASSTSTLVINKATTTNAGVMSAADKTKLDELSTVAQDITNLKSNKLETVEVMGTGNVITSASKSGSKLSLTKGLTVLTPTDGDTKYVKKIGDEMTGELNVNGNKVWHAGNDGSGSGLDADLLDGKHNGDLTAAYTHGGKIQSSRVVIKNDNGGNPCYFIIADCTDVFNTSAHAAHYGFTGIVIGCRYEGHSLEYVAKVIMRVGYNKYKYFLESDSTFISPCILKKDSRYYLAFKTVYSKQWVCFYGVEMNLFSDFIQIDAIDSLGALPAGYSIAYQGVGMNLYGNITSATKLKTPRRLWGQPFDGTADVSGDLVADNITATDVKINGESVVTPSKLEDTLAYWYENDENQSSTKCATGGNRNVIESLRSKFKRCIAKPYGDDAALISYTNENMSTHWPDGTTTNQNVTNRKESVMVHFPKYYHKTIERSPGIWRTYISEQQIDSDYIEEPERLVGAFEGEIHSSGLLCSRGSAVSTASKTIAEFVAAAKLNGPLYGIEDYRIHATIARMFCAYYRTTNISTSNSSIPCSGGTKRYNYGETGGTHTLGNVDGKKPTQNDTGYYSTNFLGLEDCYCSKWEFVQGINILKGKYVVYDGGSFPNKDVTELKAAGATNVRVIGYEPNSAATEEYSGWIKAIAQGKYGDVVPTANGGSETTYYSDHSWFNPTGNRIFFRSGSSDHGSRCGVFVANARDASSDSWTSIGARLAFYGKIIVVDSDTFKKNQV